MLCIDTVIFLGSDGIVYFSSIENSVDSVFQGIAGHDATVTYTTNGKHMPNSLHYGGDAIDLRTRDLSAHQIKEAVKQLREALGKKYQVIDEGDHIHIEYDPCP